MKPQDKWQSQSEDQPKGRSAWPQFLNMVEALEELGGEVAKDLTNTYGKYDYASADAIYRHCRRSLLAGGLLPYQTELSKTWHERKQGGKTVHWLEVEYALALTPGGIGGPDLPVERVTVLVPITGAQSVRCCQDLCPEVLAERQVAPQHR